MLEKIECITFRCLSSRLTFSIEWKAYRFFKYDSEGQKFKHWHWLKIFQFKLILTPPGFWKLITVWSHRDTSYGLPASLAGSDCLGFKGSTATSRRKKGTWNSMYIFDWFKPVMAPGSSAKISSACVCWLKTIFVWQVTSSSKSSHAQGGKKHFVKKCKWTLGLLLPKRPL